MNVPTQSNPVPLRPKSEVIDLLVTHLINCDADMIVSVYNTMFSNKISHDQVDWSDESFQFPVNVTSDE